MPSADPMTYDLWQMRDYASCKGQKESKGEKMELSKNEEAMVKAFRAAGLCTGNVILWCCVGIEQSIEKIKLIDQNRYEDDCQTVRAVYDVYNKTKEF
jgi:hypothetical protein